MPRRKPRKSPKLKKGVTPNPPEELVVIPPFAEKISAMGVKETVIPYNAIFDTAHISEIVGGHDIGQREAKDGRVILFNAQAGSLGKARNLTATKMNKSMITQRADGIPLQTPTRQR